MNDAALWTARWTRKLLDFLFWIRLRAASQGCRNLLRTSARKGATGTEPRIRTVRQLAAAAGDGPLGFAGSPGQLETSLNSGYTVGPCNSYLEGPTLIFFGRLLAPFCLGLLLAQSRLRSAAVVVIRRGRTPLLSPPPCGGARFADARSPRGRTLTPARHDFDDARGDVHWVAAFVVGRARIEAVCLQGSPTPSQPGPGSFLGCGNQLAERH